MIPLCRLILCGHSDEAFRILRFFFFYLLTKWSERNGTRYFTLLCVDCIGIFEYCTMKWLALTRNQQVKKKTLASSVVASKCPIGAIFQCECANVSKRSWRCGNEVCAWTKSPSAPARITAEDAKQKFTWHMHAHVVHTARTVRLNWSEKCCCISIGRRSTVVTCSCVRACVCVCVCVHSLSPSYHIFLRPLHCHIIITYIFSFHSFPFYPTAHRHTHARAHATGWERAVVCVWLRQAEPCP